MSKQSWETFKMLLRDINTTKQQLMNMLANGEVPKMKMNKLFAKKIKEGLKTKEFRKAKKFNQTSWVAIVDMNTEKFLYFIFITPELINPEMINAELIFKKGTEPYFVISKEKAYELEEYLDPLCDEYGDTLLGETEQISKEEYNFVQEKYVNKEDFVMFNIDKVIV